MARSLMSGMRPSLCARNSSLSTEELVSISTRSMASVGTSAIMMRRSALATLASVSRSSNFITSSFMSRMRTVGNRWYDTFSIFFFFFPSSSQLSKLLQTPPSKAAPKLHSLNLQSSKAPSLDSFARTKELNCEMPWSGLCTSKSQQMGDGKCRRARSPRTGVRTPRQTSFRV